ncbi:MAG TPA: hypothetical protein VF933_19405 [Streptosporangiaceae bacterium]|jgi:hypothetical protein
MDDVSELERQARELLRPEVYEYYAGGSGGEVTLRAHVMALAGAASVTALPGLGTVAGHGMTWSG